MPDLHSIESALLPLGFNKARIKCLAAFLVALLARQSVCLTKIAPIFPTNAKPESAYKRLQRFLKEFELNLDQLARFLAVLCRVEPPWTLAIDRTNWKLGRLHLNLLMLSIVTEGVAFPLLWMPLAKKVEGSQAKIGKTGSSSTAERIELIQRFIRLFGADKVSCLLADREFLSRGFLTHLESQKITYCFRAKSSLLIANGRGQLCCANWLFRNSAFQRPRKLGKRLVLGTPRFVCGTRLPGGDYLIVVSNFDSGLEIYAKRWGIETLFGSLKSRGFDLEATHVSAPDRLTRLVALVALAYTWAAVSGVWLFSQIALKLKKHGRLPVSRFRLGLDWLQPLALKLCRTINEKQGMLALQFLSCT